MQNVALRRLDGVIITPGPGVSAPLLAAFVGNMLRLGYAFTVDTLSRLEASSQENLEEILQAARELKGDWGYTPMYPNFPKQVAEASALELYRNALLHYLGDWVGGVRIMPKYAKDFREALQEEVEVRVLQAVEEEDLRGLTQRLVTLGRPHGEDEWADILKLASFVEVEEITVKENLAWLAATFPGPWKFHHLVDVLRLAVAYSGGETSLKVPSKFKLARRERRDVLKHMDALLAAGADPRDMARHQEEWKRLATSLHHREYSYPLASAALEAVQRGQVRSWNSEVEEALQGDLEKLLELLRERPGVFARRLAEVERKFPGQEETIAQAFQAVGGQVALPVLVQAWQHFQGPTGGELGKRVVSAKGRPLAFTNRHKPSPLLLEALEGALAAHAREDFKVFLKEGAGVAVPLNLREASRGKTLAKGSRRPLGSKGTVRLFQHWRDTAAESPEGRVDLDLSASFVDETFTRVAAVAYYNLRMSGQSKHMALHSGDITSAPKGAAEYIDVDMSEALAAGWRYLIPSVFNFTRQPLKDVPEACAGFMLREEVDSGEIFEPALVEESYFLTGEENTSVPFVIDLKTRELIWWDAPVRTAAYGPHNVGLNQASFQELLESLVKSRFMTVEELYARLFTLVTTKEDAEAVVDARRPEEVWSLLQV